MAWKIKYSDSALKEMGKLDRQHARRILDFMDNRIAVRSDPRTHGKALTGPLGALWRFRLGEYRIICDIQDMECIILVLTVGNRKNVYR